MKSVLQIMPTDQWFYIGRTPEPMESAICIYRIAAWALQTDGTVVGLIGMPWLSNLAYQPIKNPCLTELPNIEGIYKHLDDFTQQEWDAYNNHGYLRLSKPAFDDIH